MKRNKTEKKCLLCDNKFEVSPWEKKQHCSRECFNKTFIGKKSSESTKLKISISNKNRIFTEEQIQKRNNILKQVSKLGAAKSKEWRQNKTYEELYGKEKAEKLKTHLSKAHIGQISKTKGLTYKEYYGEEKTKIIVSKIKKTLKNYIFIPYEHTWKKGNIPWNKDKTYEELYGKEEGDQRKKEWRLLMNEKVVVPVRDTKPELQMQSILNNLNISYIKHKPINNIEHNYQCDIFIEPNIIIEVDGVYWHNYPHGREIDKIREKELKEKDYKIIRFWEDQFSEELVFKKLEEIGYIQTYNNQ